MLVGYSTWIAQRVRDGERGRKVWQPVHRRGIILQNRLGGKPRVAGTLNRELIKTG